MKKTLLLVATLAAFIAVHAQQPTILKINLSRGIVESDKIDLSKKLFKINITDFDLMKYKAIEGIMKFDKKEKTLIFDAAVGEVPRTGILPLKTDSMIVVSFRVKSLLSGVASPKTTLTISLDSKGHIINHAP